MTFIIKILVFVSIAATLFIALNVILASLGLRHLEAPITSVYCQLLALVCYQPYRIDFINFDVYREDSLPT